MEIFAFDIGEVRRGPNGNHYAFISMERNKERVALLLIQAKNQQSQNTEIISLAAQAWSRSPLLPVKNESAKITFRIRRKAYHLLHDTPKNETKK